MTCIVVVIEAKRNSTLPGTYDVQVGDCITLQGTFTKVIEIKQIIQHQEPEFLPTALGYVRAMA